MLPTESDSVARQQDLYSRFLTLPPRWRYGQVLVGGAEGYEATFMMGANEFARLKDGAQIILRFPVGVVVGRLNKSMLDR